MKTFKIPIFWQSYGVMHIEAETLEKAKEIALDAAPLPPGNYVEGSCVLDEEEAINEMNQQ
jgi:hypothetical protein